MDPRLFWDSTFYEIGLFLEGARAARRDQWNDAITTAWHAAAFVWSKKLPKLDKILRGEPEEKQRPQSARDRIDQWRTFFGRGSQREH